MLRSITNKGKGKHRDGALFGGDKLKGLVNEVVEVLHLATEDAGGTLNEERGYGGERERGRVRK